VDKFDALSAVCHFLDYPVEVGRDGPPGRPPVAGNGAPGGRALPEQNPGEVLPKVVVDAEKGGYVFRNRWQDGDDFVTTFFLDSDPDGGGWRAPDWTDFRIVGLGTEWAARGIAWGNGASARKLPNPRLYGNVLFVPEAWKRGKTGARPTKFESWPDGSGIVTANLDDIYHGSDAPITGMRSLAVDYSGQSGAPCLVAVADTVTGTAGSNVWQFCTLAEHKVAVSETGFIITAANGATLVAHVVEPVAAKITVAPVTIKHEINYHGRHAQADFQRQVISVPGNERFFVVLTIQNDTAPTMKITTNRVSIGQRTVSFNNQTLRFIP
jgi:hypothetical protein